MSSFTFVFLAMKIAFQDNYAGSEEVGGDINTAEEMPVEEKEMYKEGIRAAGVFLAYAFRYLWML